VDLGRLGWRYGNEGEGRSGEGGGAQEGVVLLAEEVMIVEGSRIPWMGRWWVVVRDAMRRGSEGRGRSISIGTCLSRQAG